MRMLLVEDSQHDADFIAMMLKRSREIEARIDHVTSLAAALEACEDSQFDIVLLDLGLPDSSGTESVSTLRCRVPDTPIVVLTGDDRYDTAMAAIDCGAQDFLPKQHVVAHMLTRMMHNSIARNNRLVRAQSEALVDDLTGLANRRSCDAELNRRLADFSRHGNSFGVALFDVDHFKQINDTWGHGAGDEVIQAVAGTIAECFQDSGHVARYGGEEFAVILPTMTIEAIETNVAKCLVDVSRLAVGKHRLQVTISAGITSMVDEDDAHSVITRADGALYAAKRQGRNRYEILLSGNKKIDTSSLVSSITSGDVE